MDIEDRKQILGAVIRIIDHISDKEYQKRVWIRGEGPEADAFDDTVCNFFGDADGVIDKYKDFPMTKEQYKVLKKFHDEFDVFADENDFPELFIDTPEWAKIMESAQEVLKAFNYKK